MNRSCKIYEVSFANTSCCGVLVSFAYMAWHCIKPSNRCHTVNYRASLASEDIRTERERALSLSRERDKGTERECQRALRRGVPRSARSLCPSISLDRLIDWSIVFLLSLSRTRTVFHLPAWSLALSLLHPFVPSLVFEPALTLSHTHTHIFPSPRPNPLHHSLYPTLAILLSLFHNTDTTTWYIRTNESGKM